MADSTTASTADQADHLAHGIRALALKKWADACDHLALAVEHSTVKHGDLAPENFEALVLYGKALLGSAIAQSAVLGGAAPQDTPETTAAVSAAGPSSTSASASGSTSTNAAAGPSNPKFHFGGDAEDEDDQDDEANGGGDDEHPDEGGDEEVAPGADREDDLESAFQVLDMARAIIQKEIDQLESALERAVKSEGEPDGSKSELEATRRTKKEKLADVHRLLGDVATESEQFDSAVDEYSAALSTLSHILAPHDRALSELHMLIALALDFVPNATSRAVAHAEKAKNVLLLKLGELEKVPEPERDDKVRREIDDIKGLLGDVDMKIEDLRTVPVAPAPTAADSALEALLKQSRSTVAQAVESGSVNDLTGLVKKKKKVNAAPADVVKEEVRPKEDEADLQVRGGAEENLVRVSVAEPGSAAAEATPKRKAEETATPGEFAEESGAVKKAKVEQ